jgi:hypothetical protein
MVAGSGQVHHGGTTVAGLRQGPFPGRCCIFTVNSITVLPAEFQICRFPHAIALLSHSGNGI